MLDIWPRLPIIVLGGHKPSIHGVDNLVAALEHNDRISEISLYRLSSSESKKVLAVMQQPFPALTRLALGSNDGTALVDPASFLGGSAPRLRQLNLWNNPLPGLSDLLLSATDLVYLDLSIIHRSGYISPEALTTCLSVLTRLETLGISLGLDPIRSRPDRRHLSPPTRTHLPVLTVLQFSGASEYLEDLMAPIDAPLLDILQVTFSHHRISNTPHLTQFISRTPKFKTHDTAHLVFSARFVSVRAFDQKLFLEIRRCPDRRLAPLAQVCGSSLPRTLISAVEHLCIIEDAFTKLPLPWQDYIENSQWLELFRPFTAAKYLYISSGFTRNIAPALQELIGERVAEVLPALRTLFLEETVSSGLVEEALGQFVGARQLAGHPISISRWERKKYSLGIMY
jgi:hypothetical protein